MHSSQTEAPEISVIEIGRYARLITSAEAELSAFMSAIDSSFGKEAAQLAGEYWVSELEIADMSFEALCPNWRRVTESALLSLIKSGCLTKCFGS